MATEEGIWIFGYGSLIWRPSFPFVTRREAYIEGWARRFWQGSPDHRGTPDAPGRVVTLVPEVGAFCAGAAYLIAAADQDAVMAHLDEREQGGYERHAVALLPAPHAPPFAEGVVYMAVEGNAHYLGPASLEALVAQVRASHGPSGANLEYVARLALALREMGAVDGHVAELDAALAACVPSAALA